MRAVLYDGPRSFAVTEVPVPEPGARDVLVKVTQTGLCGTDLHIDEGHFFAAFPLVPGHEVVGTVEAVGADVVGLRVGQAVTVNPNIQCGHCPFCREGRTLLCENLTGVGTNSPGAFAEYLTAPFPFVYPVDGLDPDVAVFTEPTSCAVHGLETLAVPPGSSALVFGAGPTGLLLAQLLKHGGAASVTVAASTRFKLERAEALGVDATVLMDRGDLAGSVRRLRELSGGGGFDVVVEATGAPEVGEQCVPLTRSGGTVLVYGVTGPDERISISPYDVFRREITIKGSFAEIDAFPAAIAAMRAGRVRADGLITHRFPLEEYGKALEALRTDRTVHKIVLTP
jgi:D-arabinitol dehydrogenase (NADP+)